MNAKKFFILTLMLTSANIFCAKPDKENTGCLSCLFALGKHVNRSCAADAYWHLVQRKGK